MTGPESTIQSDIVQYLEATGWLVRIFSQDRAVRRQLAGWVDVIGFRRGVTLLVECKVPGGKLRKRQREFGFAIAPHIAITLRYVVADCLEDVVAMVGDQVI